MRGRGHLCTGDFRASLSRRRDFGIDRVNHRWGRAGIRRREDGVLVGKGWKPECIDRGSSLAVLEMHHLGCLN
ncbi:hydroxyproline-rich glycoprotein DZ-HRGP, partial [Colletotrichum asianum]